MCEAYLDIETTGLSWRYEEITVIGMYLVSGKDSTLLQLVGMEVTADNLLDSLAGVSSVYTYNGSRFDLPFIHGSLDVDLTALYDHHDLMCICRGRGLKGGLKEVERQLGIPRQLEGIWGRHAVWLWWRYLEGGDLEALATLLAYNREDVMNLKVLKERLSRPMQQK